jgi:serine/threonine protein kinase
VWPRSEDILFITHVLLLQSNVLVHDNGRACLADFGLSTMLLDFIGPSYITSNIRGNIRWAAAELFEAPEESEEEVISLSTECDIYSFGSIFLQVSNLCSSERSRSICVLSRC